MTQGEYDELVSHFNKQFEDVLIQERSDLYLILSLIERLSEAEKQVSDDAWRRDMHQWGR